MSRLNTDTLENARDLSDVLAMDDGTLTDDIGMVNEPVVNTPRVTRAKTPRGSARRQNTPTPPVAPIIETTVDVSVTEPVIESVNAPAPVDASGEIIDVTTPAPSDEAYPNGEEPTDTMVADTAPVTDAQLAYMRGVLTTHGYTIKTPRAPHTPSAPRVRLAADSPYRTRIAHGVVLVGRYRGTDYDLTVNVTNAGRVYTLTDGRSYTSPSGAGTAITGSAVNGWAMFNRYRLPNGDTAFVGEGMPVVAEPATTPAVVTPAPTDAPAS